MKIKWVIISIVGLGILTTLIIGSVMFIQDFNKDNKETLKVMGKIKDEYKNFSPIPLCQKWKGYIKKNFIK